MKHLLTAALIAIALASPVSAREVVLNCELIGADDDELDFLLRVDAETLSAVYIQGSVENTLHTLGFNDRYVIWAGGHGFSGVNAGLFSVVGYMFHLDRQRLRLQFSHAHELQFVWADDFGSAGETQTAYQ